MPAAGRGDGRAVPPERGAAHVRSEPDRAVRAADGRDDRAGHLGVGVQGRLDLARFDAHAGDLDLLVQAPQVLQLAILAPADAVAGTVQPASRLAVRVGDEPLRRLGRPPEVAAGDAGPADVQLPRHSERGRVPGRIQHQQSHVVDGTSDGHLTGPERRVVAARGSLDGAFGRAVGVPHLGLHPLQQLGVQWLAAAQQQAHRVARPPSRLLDEQPQHRRDQLQDGHAVLGDRARDHLRVALRAGRRHDERGTRGQRGEELPYRRVEADRRALEHAVVLVDAVQADLPVDVVGDARMRDDDALGLSGRARGVQDVRRVGPIGLGAGRGLRPRGRRTGEGVGSDQGRAPVPASIPTAASSVTTTEAPVSDSRRRTRSAGWVVSSGT